ncbi:MAG: IS3 family transposase [Candidatus Jordarchaeum sp.]|uniref:IS3 family transposase n=1 Tax=Candidatus Jordarchaeum sp. TaxID=2823881 RepID=UPI0040493664
MVKIGRRGPEGKITADLLDAVKSIKQEHPNYGRTRMRRLLEKTGFNVSDSTVTRTLRRLELQLPKKRAIRA